MLAVTSIGNVFVNSLPKSNDIQHFFFDYTEQKWGVGGKSDASFAIYGAESTENEEPFKGRIDIRLSIDDHPELGMLLYYTKTGGGYREHYYSLGDESRLDEMVENRIGDKLSKGLFISPEKAWLAVKDFIEQGGVRSEKVRWVSDSDLPDEAFPEPE